MKLFMWIFAISGITIFSISAPVPPVFDTTIPACSCAVTSAHNKHSKTQIFIKNLALATLKDRYFKSKIELHYLQNQYELNKNLTSIALKKLDKSKATLIQYQKKHTSIKRAMQKYNNSSKLKTK